MINIAACDDDSVFLDNVMKKLITEAAGRCETNVNISFFSDGQSLLEQFRNGNLFDIVILDIDMPDIDGKQLAEQLRLIDSSFYLLFMSSHEKEIYNTLKYDFKTFLTKSSDVNAQLEELVRVFGKFLNESIQYEVFPILRQGQSSLYRIPLCNITSFYFTDKIIYLKTTTDQVILQEKVFSKITDKYLEKGFYPTHRNYIVNLGKIREIALDEVILSNNDRLPLSKRCRKPLLKALSEYVMFGVNN